MTSLGTKWPHSRISKGHFEGPGGSCYDTNSYQKRQRESFVLTSRVITAFLLTNAPLQPHVAQWSVFLKDLASVFSIECGSPSVILLCVEPLDCEVTKWSSKADWSILTIFNCSVTIWIHLFTRFALPNSWHLMTWANFEINDNHFSNEGFICDLEFEYSLKNDRGLLKNDTPLNSNTLYIYIYSIGHTIKVRDRSESLSSVCLQPFDLF